MALQDILGKLTTAFTEVEKAGNSFSETDFFKKPDTGKWSAGENIQHLFLSVKPLVGLFGKPELMLQFGKRNRPSLDYNGVVDLYIEKLNSPSAVAVVTRNTVAGISATQQQEMENLHAIHTKFLERAATLSDEVLDEYQIPHPLMGLLTPREFLYFTHYHTLHHTKTILDLK